MIKVLLIDDHEMVRIGVSAYLSVQDDMEVVGEASNGREGTELALKLRPDIILMDLVMDEMDGIEATKQIMKAWKSAKIIIVTSFLDDEKVYPALEAGQVVICSRHLLLLRSQTPFGLHMLATRFWNQKSLAK